ncbi:VOC family protein [Pseudomonas sp. HT11]|uniref:VOC family protein n=1 Tax=unclassified Pseudomonas TaxID=196821 RepID=UPI00118F0CAF|nr:VOC family protein [Pseudomonas sp. RGB]TVT91314.1 VOC family protein [Pseudomonas sp. RGB]
MKFASVRIVTQQFEQLIRFYQNLSTIEPRHRADGFAEIHFEGVVLAISDERLVRLHNNGLAVAASNRSAILEFQVEEVEAILLRVSSTQVVMPVTIMPWGNTCALLQDPDGNLVNIFSIPEQIRQSAAH